MGTFGKLLEEFIELRKKESYWLDKTDFYAIRAMWLALGSFVSGLLGIALGALGVGIIVSLTVMIGTAAIFIPISFLLSSLHWKTRQRNLALSEDNFNYIKYLDDKFELEVRRINQLPVSEPQKSKLILAEFKNYQKEKNETGKLIKLDRKNNNLSNIEKINSTVKEISYSQILIDERKAKLLKEKLEENVIDEKNTLENKAEKNPFDLFGLDEMFKKFHQNEPEGAKKEREILSSFISKLKENKELKREELTKFVEERELMQKFATYFQEVKESDKISVDNLIKFGKILETQESLNQKNVEKFMSDIYLIKALASENKS
jgi:hypothetical protein